ncbi:transglutaminase family protein [Sphingomonas sp.]|jgi:transglutaminase-like putative cysteine protease|uniref:transglutaminase-like domain-containing protein n=1 Tax=Sphingomonas sp. TaxID=28214 RepID=UPI002D80EA89|nr:transglutaminase family protein [Sphingomonas sp.]HEU0043401.1 transglutaminase family protein [Sphingomonas sp.]
MRLGIEVEIDYALPDPADVLLQIEAAAMPDQRIETETLTVWSDIPLRAARGEDGIGQRCWVHAVGRFQAQYHATVTIDRPAVTLATLGASAPRAVPAELTAYLLPSRYCPVETLYGFVRREFAGLAGGPLAAAIAEWVEREIAYSCDGAIGGTALDTFGQRAGVCRDFAHLVVTLARAGGIPARCVSAYAPGVDPPDFHAVAELWLDGGWHLVDATGMARAEELARVAVGRDATDIAFMTIFGRASLMRQVVRVARLD